MRFVAALFAVALMLLATTGAATAKYANHSSAAGPEGSDVALYQRAADSAPAGQTGAAGAVEAKLDEAAQAAMGSTTVADDGTATLVYVLVGVAGLLTLGTATFFGMRRYQHHHAGGRMA